MSKLLEEYLKEIEQRKERKRLEVLQRVLDVLNKLCREFSFKKAYIFGSILKKKKFYYDSDIDIAVLGLDDKVFFRLMSRLADALGRDVDIVQLENHPFKDKIVKEGLLWRKQN